MARLFRPRLLAFQTGLAPGGFSSVFAPAGTKSWEVNSLVVTGAATLQRAFDADGDGTFETFQTVDAIREAGEFHAYKLQCEARAGLRVRNDHTAAIAVFVIGIEIED